MARAKSRPKSASLRIRQYRARMRAQGLRQINLWVPDTRSPEFLREARRQSLLTVASDRRSGILEELDRAAAGIDGWT